MGECCPPGSHGPVEPQAGYIPKGRIETLDDGKVELYVSEPGERTGKAILVLHDIFGPDSGRTKQICDIYAENGFVTVLPTLLKGPYPMFVLPENGGEKVISKLRAGWYLRGFKWKAVGSVLNDHVLPFLKNNLNINSIGLVSFCWGAWPMVHLMSERHEIIKCGVGFHPSLLVFTVHMENAKAHLRKIEVPTMLFSAGNDPADGKPGGFADKALSRTNKYSECLLKEYKQMQHGWVNRGDLSDENVSRDYEDAFQNAMEMLKTNV
mmetsp:Transcript_14182/g.17568  ORF Transcript_14182/g.17568 Transcript_14182/m.17568 type:complete len:266 (+) Transcript_14182:200-997(+)|eukprot:CAMPEP_0204823812 /NCGR_PEP_ID=MMETSP1346-20131115/1879_1 /ASSEMBLY_ACC=CAM_ASM_000771 /TAXON_ID=215587 /ORGANISM="Aplanochytrium stocchinoi, Strain GSBS06" /LENGTH=265 /DNA_ID=CAMNT_0051950613 /DNA_START=209 /DNA_END=1006 /DNA_ORIENTATION=+